MKARRVDGLEPAASLRSNASRIVRTRLDELLTLAERALDPTAVAAQHDTRIAAKRLRYVLEITGRCFGAEAESARFAAKELQDVLGDVHDCDVMLPRAAGIESLESLLRMRREQLFGRFCDQCIAAADTGTWSALERAL